MCVLSISMQIMITPMAMLWIAAEFTSSALRIFLDLASEGSLKEHLDEFGSISEPLLRKYMHDIASGLSFLHSNRIIHRGGWVELAEWRRSVARLVLAAH